MYENRKAMKIRILLLAAARAWDAAAAEWAAEKYANMFAETAADARTQAFAEIETEAQAAPPE